MEFDYKNIIKEKIKKIKNILNICDRKDKEIERLNNIINRIKSIHRSMQFSSPENMYIFIEQLEEVLEELKEKE